jgi:arylsulfatase A-like enzyme
VIVLAADSLRPDHFSSEGYARQTTPNIDRLRKHAAWFADDFVPIASTTASWTSMLTGLYPQRHGVRDLFPRAENTRLHLPTLPGILHSQGYRTAVVSDYAGEMFKRISFDFDDVDTPPATSLEVFLDREIFQRLPLTVALFSGPLGQRFFPVSQYLPVNADPSWLTTRVERELDRLEADGGDPFLLVAFYSVTHAPFAPPMPDATAFVDPQYAGRSRYSYDVQQLSDLPRASARPSVSEQEQVRGLYDGALRAFDREVGRLISRLDSDGITDRLIVVTGDHGENLFEPGTTTEHGKWFVGGEAANRTALLFQGSGVPVGRREVLASGVDFLPTILDLLRIPIPADLDGLPLFRDVSQERTVFAETALWLGGPATAPPQTIAYPPLLELLEVEPTTHAIALKERYVDITVTAKLRAARHGPWELVYTPTTDLPRWQLFNLQTDPFAEHDLEGTQPEISGSLHRPLLDWLSADRLRWLDARDRLIRRVEQ